VHPCGLLVSMTTHTDYDDDDYVEMCECEVDWNCGLHQGGYTWIETRYQGLDDEEARAYGVAF
jgi:hypothetical protein